MVPYILNMLSKPRMLSRLSVFPEAPGPRLYVVCGGQSSPCAGAKSGSRPPPVRASPAPGSLVSPGAAARPGLRG